MPDTDAGGKVKSLVDALLPGEATDVWVRWLRGELSLDALLMCTWNGSWDGGGAAAEEVGDLAMAHEDFPRAFVVAGGVAPLARLACAGIAAMTAVETKAPTGADDAEKGDVDADVGAVADVDADVDVAAAARATERATHALSLLAAAAAGEQEDEATTGVVEGAETDASREAAASDDSALRETERLYCSVAAAVMPNALARGSASGGSARKGLSPRGSEALRGAVLRLARLAARARISPVVEGAPPPPPPRVLEPAQAAALDPESRAFLDELSRLTTPRTSTATVGEERDEPDGERGGEGVDLEAVFVDGEEAEGGGRVTRRSRPAAQPRRSRRLSSSTSSQGSQGRRGTKTQVASPRVSLTTRTQVEAGGDGDQAGYYALGETLKALPEAAALARELGISVQPLCTHAARVAGLSDDSRRFDTRLEALAARVASLGDLLDSNVTPPPVQVPEPRDADASTVSEERRRQSRGTPNVGVSARHGLEKHAGAVVSARVRRAADVLRAAAAADDVDAASARAVNELATLRRRLAAHQASGEINRLRDRVQKLTRARSGAVLAATKEAQSAASVVPRLIIAAEAWRGVSRSLTDEEGPALALRLMEAVAETLQTLQVADEIAAFAAEAGTALRAEAEAWDRGAGTASIRKDLEVTKTKAGEEGEEDEDPAPAGQGQRTAQVEWLVRAASTLRPHLGGDVERDLVHLHPSLLATAPAAAELKHRAECLRALVRRVRRAHESARAADAAGRAAQRKALSPRRLVRRVRGEVGPESAAVVLAERRLADAVEELATLEGRVEELEGRLGIGGKPVPAAASEAELTRALEALVRDEANPA